MQTKRIVLVGLVIASLAGISVAWTLIDSRLLAPPPRKEDIGRSLITGEFSLTDHTNRPVTQKDYNGFWRLVFFGYTHCPDVCPTTLGTISLIMEDLGGDAAKLKPLFITVDPERDTPDVLADYVTAFDERIVGLSGTPEQVAAAAKTYNAYYAKVLLFEGDVVRTDDYAMNHSARLYLMDAKGVYATSFSPADPVEKTVAVIRDQMNR